MNGFKTDILGLASLAWSAASHFSWWEAILIAVAIGYRLLVEAWRKETLRELVTRAPANTVVFVDKGPGGPAMCVKVGSGQQEVQRPEVWREP